MENSSPPNWIAACLDGIVCACFLYIGMSNVLGHSDSSALVRWGALAYSLFAGILFGVASASLLLGWRSRQALHYIALSTLLLPFVIVFFVKLAAKVAA
jgi:hypothetical protein